MNKTYVDVKNQILVETATRDCLKYFGEGTDVNVIVGYLTGTPKSVNCTRLSDRALKHVSKLDADFITRTVQGVIKKSV